MKKKTSIIFHSSLLLLSTFLAWSANQIEMVDFVCMGETIGYKWLMLTTTFCILAFIFLLSYIFLTNPEPTNRYPKTKKTNIILRICNRIHYPTYIWYKEFWWKINKNFQNKFIVVSLPLCPDCCNQIIFKKTDFNGKYICPCGKNFREYNFETMKIFIINQLSVKGIKSFQKISKNPC